MTRSSLPREVARALFANPVALLLLQVPGGVLELVGRGVELRSGESLILAAALFFPYSIAGAISTALTYAYLVNERKSGRVAYGTVMPKLGRLIPVACLASFLCLAGMVALLLPALYFMTMLFVFPQLVVSEERLPWSVYLVRSKKLVRPHFWTTLLLVVASFALEMGVERLGSVAGSALGELFSESVVRYAILLGVQVFLFMVMSATINTWAAYFFLRLKASANEKHLGTA